ncbi:hypothetical protein [Aminobacter sp. HY435]|uniref:hypothetical protein n=1 Tax=Aminobacter sp. HY435 TaxID=2970917 RepID=UPI0022B989B0|nr:hypothetical protein [Aminobacter sp. HY435]
MRLKDEVDFVKEDRQDLVARLMGAQAMGHFLLNAYSALRSYGVDFMKLPEWQDQKELEDAAKLKPHAAQWKVLNYTTRLENALKAAIRRKQFKVHDFKPDPDKPE